MTYTEDLVHARNRQLAEAADLVEFLVVDGDPNASRLLRDDHQRARARRGRALDQTCRKVLVQGSLNFLGHHGIDAVRPGRVIKHFSCRFAGLWGVILHWSG